VTDRRRIVLLVGLALAARLLILAEGGTARVHGYEFTPLAGNLLAGRGYVYHHLGTDYQAFYGGVPYVLLVAAGYAVNPRSSLWILLIQAVAAAGLTVAAFAIGRRFGGPTVASVAAALVALHPGMLYYDTHKVHPLSFDALVIALTVVGLLRLRETMAGRAAVLAGLAFGVALLQRGTMILVPVAAAVWLVAVGPGRRARLGRVGVAYALGALLVVGPWVARNWVVLGTPLLASVGPEVLWRGNAPQSMGGSYTRSGSTVLDAAPELGEAVSGRPELEQAAIFRAAALSNAADRPLAFLWGIGRKFLLFWSFGAGTGREYPAVYLYLYGAYYAAIVILALIGLAGMGAVRTWPSGAFATLALLAAVALSVAFVQSIFYVELRHRWGVEAFVLVVAAPGLIRVWRAMRGGPSLSSAGP
jgi:4-amino-4-deoxy-L-arabinose transferase-like glycosyltransferase